MFTDDQIVTFWGAAITLPQLGPGGQVPAKDGLVRLVKMTFKVDFEPMLCFVGMYDPIKRVLGNQTSGVVIGAYTVDLNLCGAIDGTQLCNGRSAGVSFRRGSRKGWRA
jgi:hypothetical protein